MVLAVSAAYGVARVDVADSVEEADAALSVVADEPAPAASPSDINAHIVEVSTRHGVAPKLVAAIVAVESRFDHRAVSRRGAEGLMQLMPATAANLDVQDAFDPRDNLDGGVRHLKRLMGRFRGDLPLVLAAYNAGETAVIAHRGIPPYRETRQYVVRVLRRYDPEAARAVVRQLAAPAKPTPVSGVARVTLVREGPVRPPDVEEHPRPLKHGESP
ncbi:MAG TPA: lytic transglycosylase domain-containing protein [Methylomirabilota bacterium]|jgi:soluble lytic murein transglycosylase-like protein|nr:lytic transglycosylase domain-containing protein [Methylomirabilota bacterium]